MICDHGDMVVVPFPFVDTSSSKRRPALVLSNREFNRGGWTTMVMVTSARHSSHPYDTALRDLTEAGLSTQCVVRFKLFSIDNTLILEKIGKCSRRDRMAVSRALNSILGHIR